MIIQKQPKILYLSDSHNPDFEEKRKLIDIVCIGDSITGWNNARFERLGISGTSETIYSTYPQFLQDLEKRFAVVDCGIAGAYSRYGWDYLINAMKKFQNAKYFVIGYGTNDLGERFRIAQLEQASKHIIGSIDKMTNELLKQSKQPILINIPNLNELELSEEIIEISRRQRDYHNKKLKQYCDEQNIPLADICSVLKDEHFADALHPNEAGARLIAREVYELIKSKKQCATHT